jgi:hypothetical protein
MHLLLIGDDLGLNGAKPLCTTGTARRGRDSPSITIGFKQWHTHGDMLGDNSTDEHIQAALEFIRSIVEDEVQLVISYVDGAFEDAWVTDDPAKEERYCQPNEELLVGTWSELAA